MEATRRGFMRFAGLSIGSVSMFGSTACWVSGGVYSAILAYTTAGLQAFQSVVDLLSGSGVIPVGSGTALDLIIAAVKAAFADIQVAVQAYDNAPADQKLTLGG